MRDPGEDLILLAMTTGQDPSRMTTLQHAVACAALARLAGRGRIRVDAGGITVRDATTVGEPSLDDALTALAGTDNPVRVATFLRRGAGELTRSRIQRLVDIGVIRVERPRRLFRREVLAIVDADRSAGAREHVDRISRSDGPVPADDAMMAAFVVSAHLHVRLYPGLPGWPQRLRLETLAGETRMTSTVLTDSYQILNPSPAGTGMTNADLDAIVRESFRHIVTSVTRATHHVEHTLHGAGHDGGHVHHHGGGH